LPWEGRWQGKAEAEAILGYWEKRITGTWRSYFSPTLYVLADRRKKLFHRGEERGRSSSTEQLEISMIS
jgi:hypothetical protein